MFKVFNQQLPNYFNDLFIPNSDIHNYNTTQASDFHISFSRTKSRQLSIVIYAKSWDKLDDNLKCCRTLLNFKYKYKKKKLCPACVVCPIMCVWLVARTEE